MKINFFLNIEQNLFLAYFVLLIIMVIALTVFLAGMLVFYLGEMLYAQITGKPILIHSYLKLRKLSYTQHQFLASKFKFYRQLNPEKQKVFGHRVLQFRDRKDFIARGTIEITDTIKLLVSAIAVMLTFGMRRYLMPSVQRFIIYPEQYESVISKADHIGEFNPALKTIVFSWKDFLDGHEIENDNLNLGVHEFAHALSYESLKTRDGSAIIFAHGLAKIDKLLAKPTFLAKLQESSYLRDYARVNKYEFFAVCLEHFIETPKAFEREFPLLFKILRRMLNFK